MSLCEFTILEKKYLFLFILIIVCVFTNYYKFPGKEGILRIIQTLSKLFLGIIYYIFEIPRLQIKNNQKIVIQLMKISN
jgi:hypothetical protein